MNNMNMNWMMNPSNLFGKRDAGRSCNQYASRPTHNYMHETDNAMPDYCHYPGSGELENAIGPMGPRGEPGLPGPMGPPGYPQNSIFASFSGQGLVMPERGKLPLEADISDITQNISLCDNGSVVLAPGYYAVTYYVSAVVRRSGFVRLTPIFNDCKQTLYSACAEAVRRKELLALSRHFIIEVADGSALFFAWHSSAGTSRVNMNLSIEKLLRQ